MPARMARRIRGHVSRGEVCKVNNREKEYKVSRRVLLVVLRRFKLELKNLQSLFFS